MYFIVGLMNFNKCFIIDVEVSQMSFVTHPKLLDGFNCESKGEDNGRRKS
jgi:hypothetical protein